MKSALMKEQLIKHLKGGMAFMSLDKMLDEIAFDHIAKKPNNLPYSIFDLLYHIVYAQRDILQFCSAENYQRSEWPKDYWPQPNTKVDSSAWDKLKRDFFADRKSLTNLINDSDDLMAVVKHGDDQSLFREILLVIEHNAYHTGQLLILLRLTGDYD